MAVLKVGLSLSNSPKTSQGAVAAVAVSVVETIVVVAVDMVEAEAGIKFEPKILTIKPLIFSGFLINYWIYRRRNQYA